jgi:hypothetical protein
MIFIELVVLLGGASTVLAVHAPPATTISPSPTVALDYMTLTLALGNSSIDFYKYQNIRYAAIPTGTLRWQPP